MLETCAISLSDNNGIRTHKHLVRKRTLNRLAKLAITSEETVEAVLYSVPISAPSYKEVNLHLAKIIDSTTDQFKALMDKARKFTENNYFKVNNIAHPSLKKLKDIVKETHTWKKNTTLIMGDSILPQIRGDKLYEKGTIKVRFFPGTKFDDFYRCTIPLVNKKPDRIVLHMRTNNARYCTPDKMIDQRLRLKNLSCRDFQLVRLFLFQRYGQIIQQLTNGTTYS